MITQSSNSTVMQTAMRAIQVLLLLAGLSSLLFLAKGTVDLSNLLSAFRDSVRRFMSSSLYICIIVNSMVALILALSAFHGQENDKQDLEDTCKIEALDHSRHNHHCDIEKVEIDDGDLVHQGKKAPNSDGPVEEEEAIVVDSGSPSNEQRNEAMDATWKAITGGGKHRQLNKSETLGGSGTINVTSDVARLLNSRQLRKSETFQDARRVGQVPIRRDPSTGLEELNKQVEAFIAKFNRDMRLQRQESDQRFMDMINRGL